MKVKKIFIALLIGCAFIACEKKSLKNFSLTTKIKGFKKGTAFLEAWKDSVWVGIDSVKVLQKNEFVMGKKLAYPQILRFSIDKKKEHSTTFFAENKPMILEASLEKLGWKNKVSGSKNDSILQLFETQIKELRFRRLKLVKEKVLAVKEKNNKKLNALEKKDRAMLKNQYLFGVNFVARHRNYEVAPYIALTYLNDVNNQFLTKILDTLAPTIKKGFYAQKLQNFIVKRPLKK